MAQLITVPEVMTLLGVAPEYQSEAEEAISQAIEGATSRLSTQLETELRKGNGSAAFYVDPESFSGLRPAGSFRLLLENGFLAEPPTVNYCTPLGVIEGPVHEGSYAVDMKYGLVLLDPEYFTGRYVRVDSVSGFDDPAALKAKYPWLNQALVTLVPMVMNSRRSDKGEGASPNGSSYRLFGDMAEGLTSLYNRKIGLTLRPFWTDWEISP